MKWGKSFQFNWRFFFASFRHFSRKLMLQLCFIHNFVAISQNKKCAKMFIHCVLKSKISVIFLITMWLDLYDFVCMSVSITVLCTVYFASVSWIFTCWSTNTMYALHSTEFARIWLCCAHTSILERHLYCILDIHYTRSIIPMHFLSIM